MARLDAYWSDDNPVSRLLLPLSWLFCFLAMVRRQAYRVGILRTRRLPVPVIVVGNITVGGTGKTPLVLWLVNLLRTQGYRPGIASRGYGGSAHEAVRVEPDGDAALYGDEPLLLARRGGCPVVITRDRVAAARLLHERYGCDVIVSDDGLQHYRLARDIEIAVLDGDRGLGNGRCLPAGPLREPAHRLRQVDVQITNGGGDTAAMTLRADRVCNLATGETSRLEQWRGKAVHAIAGIGNPERFFAMLRRFGLNPDPHPFPDHYPFAADDLAYADGQPILMTEKDAVKCRPFATPDHWYVPVDADVADSVETRLLNKLKEVQHG